MRGNDVVEFWVEVAVDGEALQDGYDGDLPLPDNKQWCAYSAFLWSKLASGKDEIVDSLHAIWASEDADGVEYIRETIVDQLLGSRVDMPAIDDLNIVWK